MSKKGVFGVKSTPLDHAFKPEKPAKSAHISSAKGGFVVHLAPNKDGSAGTTHVAVSMSEVEKLVNKHLAELVADDMDGKTNSKPAPKFVAPKE